MGDRVSATMPEITTVPARVNANSVNREPTRPPIKPIGAYTATSVVVIAMIGMAISRAPFRAASKRDSPCSRSEEHTSELQSRPHLVCRLLLEKKKKTKKKKHKETNKKNKIRA